MSAKNPLTKMEARSLREAAKKPRLGAPIAKDAGRLEVKPATARRLVAKGFAQISAGRLIVTPEGHRVLNEPNPHHAVYLTARGGTLTDRLELAMRDEPEVIDPDTLKAFHREQALVALAEVRDRREHARQLKRQVSRRPLSPVDIRFDPAQATYRKKAA